MFWVYDCIFSPRLHWLLGMPNCKGHGLCPLGSPWLLRDARSICEKTVSFGTSLVVQWLRICLPMQGTRVRSLVQEDPTCRGANKPVGHNYWACTLEPASHNYWAHVTTIEARTPRAHAPQQGEATAMRSPRTTTKSIPCSLQLEWKPARSNEDPTQPKINK